MTHNRIQTAQKSLDATTTRRKLIRGTAGAAAGSALFASAARWPNVIRAQDPVTLSLWWSNSPTEPAWEESQEFLDLFHELHPDIRVEPQDVSLEQIRNRIVVAAQGGQLPDIVWALPEDITTYYQLGLLADFTERWADWDEREGIVEQGIDGLTFDDRTYSGMPETSNTRAYLYHASQFEAAGVTAAPETWDDLITAGQALTESGVPGFGYCGTSVRMPQEFIVYLWQNDLNLAVDTGDGTFRNTWVDNPEEHDRAAEVFQFYYDLMVTHGVVPREATAWGYQELDTRLAQATIASAVDGPWMQSYVETNPVTMEDIAVAAVPYKLTPATFLEVGYAVTFADAPNLDQAWEFLQFVGSKQAQSLPWFGADTARTDVPLEEGTWNEPFKSLIPQGQTWPPIALGQITQHMIDSVQSVLLEQSSPEDAARTLSEQTNAALVEQGQG